MARILRRLRKHRSESRLALCPRIRCCSTIPSATTSLMGEQVPARQRLKGRYEVLPSPGSSMPCRVALTLASASVASRSEEHTSELQSLMRISYAVFCLKNKKTHTTTPLHYTKSKH